MFTVIGIGRCGMAVQEDRVLLLGRVARMYYEQGATQETIATELRLSRPTVSRLLKEAREEGVVQIIIHNPVRYANDLEGALRSAFPFLRKVIVVQPDEAAPEEEVVRDVAKASADYIRGLVRPGDVIGVSWGNTLEQVTLQLQIRAIDQVTVVQLNGGVSQASMMTNAYEIAQRFGKAFEAQVYFLPLPAVVDGQAVKEALLTNTETAYVLELGRKANIAVYGIGHPGGDSVLVQAGYFTPAQVQEFRRRGAVGDICSRYFTVTGQICDPELDSRTIGLPLHALAAKEHAIAVVPGKHKAAGALGALRGRYLNELITDEATAREILVLHASSSMS